MATAFVTLRAGPRPTDQIVAALKSDLSYILQREIAGLSHVYGPNAVYETVMGDYTLLDQCLKLFRSRPELFDDSVVDGECLPVTDDNAMLSCRRTLGEAIALIVRACARRHFRRALGGTRMVPRPSAARMGWWRRIQVRAGLASPPPPRLERVPGAGDCLYTALRDHLRFDWQAALIPFYTPLSPITVSRLGRRILDIREPGELTALAEPEARATVENGGQPLWLDTAQRLMPLGGDTIDAEILWAMCRRLDLGRLYPGHDGAKLRRALAQVAGTSQAAIGALMPVLGGDIRLFVTFLFTAHAVLGDDGFRHAFRDGPLSDLVAGCAARLAAAPLPPPAFEAMRTAFSAILAATPAMAG